MLGAPGNNAVSWAYHEAGIPLSFALETRGRRKKGGVRQTLAQRLELDRRWIPLVGEEIAAMCLRLGLALI